MKFLSRYWYDIGGILGICVMLYIGVNFNIFTHYQFIVWLSLLSLFLHQLEEYRIIGTFPGMTNGIMFQSDLPDRYPLNARSSVYVNVHMGWLTYFLAAVFAEKAIWLGIATILVSIGNTFAHTIMFNVRGKTFFNAGMITSVLLFAPLAYFFFLTIHEEKLVSTLDYWIGIPLGLILNFIGILGLIFWLKDRNTTYIFPQRNLLASQRK